MTPSGSWHFAFRERRLLVLRDDRGARVPDEPQLLEALAADPGGLVGAEVPLPLVEGRSCHAYDLPHAFEPPAGFELIGLRAAAALLPEGLFHVAGTALQKVEWLRTHGFCSRCGHATERHATYQAMACAACGHLHFPRLSPAVIVLVERDRQVLLARSHGFPEGMYSTLAGFVEPGESLEETVHREIREEVGVSVTDLRYFGSQPWPFPHSLMIGFFARWSGGEIRLDPTEIEDAAWFDAGRLPRIPPPVSIARRLIDAFVDRARG